MAAGNSSKSSRLVGAAAIVAAALAVYAILQMNAKLGNSEREAKAQAKHVAELSNQLARMQDSMQTQSAEGPRTSTIIVQAPGVAPVAPQGSAATQAPGAAPAPGMTPQEMNDSVEASFVSEGTDPSWSHQATDTARAAIASRLPAGGRVDAVECRSSICRVEATLPNQQAYREYAFPRRRHLDDAWEGPSMVTLLHTESDGAVVSVSYLGRAGSGPLVRD
jgi:hypothetical protein